MLNPNQFKRALPKSFLWRLTMLNIVVIASAIALSGWALYNTACSLVEGIGNLSGQKQLQFNATLSQYLWIFSIIGIIGGSILHFYLTKKLINPIRQLIESTKRLKSGDYPEPIEMTSEDEVGELVQQYNGLIDQLQMNEDQRQKVVSDLSHEFRTPLSNLNGYLQALDNGVIKGDQELFQSLYRESSRLTQMVEQLEQLKEWDYLSSHTIFHKQTVDMAEQINQCVAMFEWTLTKTGIDIEIDATSKDVLVQVEGIQQVISNLLDNAIKFYEGSGPIVIKGEAQSDSYAISITGPSQFIPEAEREKVFDRFYRLDHSRSRETGGTGLGLAIVKEIVENHHGEIHFENANEYNCFSFSIPYSYDETG